MQDLPHRLLDAFLALHDREEVGAFLTDVFSEPELVRLAARWDAWELLASRELSLTEVSKRTGVSRVTVGRADKVLRDPASMLHAVIGRLNTDEEGSGS